MKITFLKVTYSKWQLLMRSVFTGSIIGIVVLLSKVGNSFWAGIFTMFPAATFSTLIILHYYYDPKYLFYFMKSAALGSISLFIYAISVMFLFPEIGIWAGTLVACFFSLIFSLLLIRIRLKSAT